MVPKNPSTNGCTQITMKGPIRVASTQGKGGECQKSSLIVGPLGRWVWKEKALSKEKSQIEYHVVDLMWFLKKEALDVKREMVNF